MIIQFSTWNNVISDLILDSPEDFVYKIVKYENPFDKGLNRLIFVPNYSQKNYSFLTSLKNRGMVEYEKICKLFFGGFVEDIIQNFTETINLNISFDNYWGFSPNEIIKLIFDSEVDEIKIPKFGIYFRVSGIAPEKGIKSNRKFFEKLFKKTNGKCGIKKVVDCKIYETIFFIKNILIYFRKSYNEY